MNQTLSEYLKQQSLKICRYNECTDEQHHCESYAYITRDGRLMDICYPDFFQGANVPYAAIALPWDGTQTELEEEIEDQCFDMSDEA